MSCGLEKLNQQYMTNNFLVKEVVEEVDMLDVRDVTARDVYHEVLT